MLSEREGVTSLQNTHALAAMFENMTQRLNASSVAGGYYDWADASLFTFAEELFQNFVGKAGNLCDN